MKAVHWLFLISMGLFVAGIGLVVAGARSSRQASRSAAPVTTPVASVKQIMKGIVGPAATVVYNSVGANITAQGVEEWAPKTDEEWEAVGTSAAALVESGNLLMMGNRVVDTGDWIKMSQAMIDGGKEALKAVAAKNSEGLMASGEPINGSCDACHQRYERH